MQTIVFVFRDRVSFAPFGTNSLTFAQMLAEWSDVATLLSSLTERLKSHESTHPLLVALLAALVSSDVVRIERGGKRDAGSIALAAQSRDVLSLLGARANALVRANECVARATEFAALLRVAAHCVGVDARSHASLLSAGIVQAALQQFLFVFDNVNEPHKVHSVLTLARAWPRTGDAAEDTEFILLMAIHVNAVADFVLAV